MAPLGLATRLLCLAAPCARSFETCDAAEKSAHLSLLQTSVRTQRNVASMVASRAASSSSQGLSSSQRLLDEDWDEPPKTHGAAVTSFEQAFIQSESEVAAEAAARQVGKQRDVQNRQQKVRREADKPHLDPLVAEIAGYDWDEFNGEASATPKVGPSWETQWEKNYRLKEEGSHDATPKDTQEQREAAQQAREERRAKKAESRRAAIEERLAASVAADQKHEKAKRETSENTPRPVESFSEHERFAPDNTSSNGKFATHNMPKFVSNASSSDETASKTQPAEKIGEGQTDLSDNADSTRKVDPPTTNASHGSEMVAKHTAHTVLGYVLQRGQRCGVCGDSNNIRLGQQGDAFDTATRATAVKVCGPVCDKHVECGGFNFVESLGNCYYRKVTSCQEVEDEDRDCYAKGGASAGAAQAKAAEVVAGQLHGLAQDLKGASAALGGVGNAQKAGPSSGHGLPSLGFIKTPRTGGSTVADILMRIGEAKNLSFFLPSGSGNHAKSRLEEASFGWPGPFPGSDAAALNGAPVHQFDVLCHGGVFAEREMQAYLKGPKPFFFTLLRRPALQMASSFNFFEHTAGDSWDERVAWLTKLWLSDGDTLFGDNAAVLRSRFQNPQAHDLGWYQRVGGTALFDQDDGAIAAWVQELEESLSLVMLTEHLDEGLVLLGRKLGLGLAELAHAGRHERAAAKVPELSQKDAAALEELAHVDVSAYAYFNRSFWESWEAAGGYGSLSADLAELKRRNAELDRACADKDETLCPWSFMVDTEKLTEHVKRRQLAAAA